MPRAPRRRPQSTVPLLERTVSKTVRFSITLERFDIELMIGNRLRYMAGQKGTVDIEWSIDHEGGYIESATATMTETETVKD